MSKIQIQDSVLNNSPIIIDSTLVTNERPNRKITEEMIIKLEEFLPEDNGKTIFFGMQSSKPETVNLTREIKTQLEQSGRKIGDISIVGNFPCFNGDISFKDWGDSFEIYVADKN